MTTITQNQLSERLRLFTEASLTWCARESEAATGRVSQTVSLILDNATRVSSISQESLAVLQGLRETIKKHTQADKKTPVHQLLKSLETLATEHEEANAIISPIVEALQFQDRMRQNFENMSRMLGVWLEERSKLGAEVSEEELQNFGRALMAKTTMPSERNVVRQHIAGLEPEAAAAPVLLF